MSTLWNIAAAVDRHDDFVSQQVNRARTDSKFRGALLRRWHGVLRNVGVLSTPTGIPLPRVALPLLDEPGEIARFVFGEGLPGEFPFVSRVYRELYLNTESDPRSRRSAKSGFGRREPTRLRGLRLAEDTNERFRYLIRQQKSMRLSTAFDGPTLYGLDSDAEGVFRKIGEGG
jgi:methylmalonyl-CoA mutase